MLKNYGRFIVEIIVIALLIRSATFANELRTFIAEETSFPIVVDGTPIKLDMPVVTIEDRTYLPLRSFGGVIGADVEWNEEKQQVEVEIAVESNQVQQTKKNYTKSTNSEAQKNNSELGTFIADEVNFPIVVDGIPVKLDMPIVTIEDRTYLPLRTFGGLLGIDVEWNEEKQQVEVETTAGLGKILQTKNNFKTNNEINKGNVGDIIKSSFNAKDKLYVSDIGDKTILEVDRDSNIIILNWKYHIDESNGKWDYENSTSVYDFIKVTPDGKSTTLDGDITNGRNTKILFIKMEGDIVVWAEYTQPAVDIDHGIYCSIYYSDLNTQKTMLIDDKVVLDSTATGAETPEYFSITPQYISYSILEYDEQKKAKEVIKLYDLSKQNLQVIASYPVMYGGTYTASLSDDYLVWGDDDYNINLYNLTTKKKTILKSVGMFMNPVISGNYICAVNYVKGEAFNRQICVYSISDNEWQYKINGHYSVYPVIDDPDWSTPSLYHITKSGKYFAWATDNGAVPALVFNAEVGVLYTVDEYTPEIYKNHIALYSGNLLSWFESFYGDEGSRYVFLK